MICNLLGRLGSLGRTDYASDSSALLSWVGRAIIRERCHDSRLIFDFNGVLVDDEALHFELFRETLGALGIPLSEEEYYERYVGFDDRRAFEEALRGAGRLVAQADVDALIERKARAYLRRVAEGLRYFDGAAECVRALASQWPLAVNSGALRKEIDIALRSMDISHLVCAIVSAEDAERCKPDPEGYLLALDALRAARGEDLEAGHCLVIEDTAAGVQSAKAAGMWVVGVTNTSDEAALRAAGADALIPTLRDFGPESVRSLFQPEVWP